MNSVLWLLYIAILWYKTTTSVQKVYSYLLFNKHTHISVNSKFSVHESQSKIEKSNSVKYLGLLIDDKYLILQLVKSSCSMLHQVRVTLRNKLDNVISLVLRVVALVI